MSPQVAPGSPGIGVRGYPDTRPPIRILVVDDNAINRLFLERVLGAFGECSCASNGLDGIKLFARALDEGRPYQLICLDISMSGVDGLDTLARMREIEADRGIVRHACCRIVMVTGMGDEAIVKRAALLSDAYLLKPIDRATLMRLLKKFHLLECSEPAIVLENCKRLSDEDRIGVVEVTALIGKLQASLERQQSAAKIRT